ncbi:MAG: hypothetical protein CL913_05945 [Deltaproteobacteria bacterium]|nr:hypothetical protein [Deltaproteobacteria bacterium]
MLLPLLFLELTFEQCQSLLLLTVMLSINHRQTLLFIQFSHAVPEPFLLNDSDAQVIYPDKQFLAFRPELLFVHAA